MSPASKQIFVNCTFRISSRSLLNASATDAIQNFLNRARRASSLCEGFSGDRKAGIEFVVGGGDGERSLRRVSGTVEVSSSTATGASDAARLDADSSSDEDVSSSDSELSCGGSETLGLAGTLRVMTGTEGPEDDEEAESESDDDEDEEATRRLRFRVRFFGCSFGFGGAMFSVGVIKRETKGA